MTTDTELKLSFWRHGSTNAERLAAAALRLHGFEQIDPQSPLGGPDGSKDIICAKGGITYIGAVYFATKPVSFSSIKKKFTSDLTKSPNSRQGFVFITNQNLSPTERKKLTAIATSEKKECEIIHLQLLQTLLNSPSGYGVRIEFLRIPMSIEEQLSWVIESDSQSAKAISAQTRELLALRASIEQVNKGQAHIMRTMALATPISTPDLISASSFLKSDKNGLITASLSPEMILMIHRLTCFDLPSRQIGQIRSQDVFLGNHRGILAEHVKPSPPKEIDEKLESLCKSWREEMILTKNHEDKLLSVCRFHSSFLLIHPFIDGNGRVARAILMQQCLDLFDKADMSLLNKGADYYAALKSADAGDFTLLKKLLKPVIMK